MSGLLPIGTEAFTGTPFDVASVRDGCNERVEGVGGMAFFSGDSGTDKDVLKVRRFYHMEEGGGGEGGRGVGGLYLMVAYAQ